MKQGSFNKEIFIKADAVTVMKVISDYSQHHIIHPLIVKVEKADNTPKGVKRYFITDSLQWGQFKFKIKYRADILSVTNDTVHTEAYQSPGTYIKNVTKVLPTPDGVRLHETITMRAPNLLFNFAFSQAETAHGEMLERIKNFVETNPKP
jgi:hypothetical protein